MIYGASPFGSEALRDVLQKEPGLTVEVLDVHWPQFNQGLSRKTFPAYELTWVADFPDPETFLWNLFAPPRQTITRSTPTRPTTHCSTRRRRHSMSRARCSLRQSRSCSPRRQRGAPPLARRALHADEALGKGIRHHAPRHPLSRKRLGGTVDGRSAVAVTRLEDYRT